MCWRLRKLFSEVVECNEESRLKLWLVGDGFQYLLCGVGVYSEDRGGDCREDPVQVVVLRPLHGDFIAKLLYEIKASFSWGEEKF